MNIIRPNIMRLASELGFFALAVIVIVYPLGGMHGFKQILLSLMVFSSLPFISRSYFQIKGRVLILLWIFVGLIYSWASVNQAYSMAEFRTDILYASLAFFSTSLIVRNGIDYGVFIAVTVTSLLITCILYLQYDLSIQPLLSFDKINKVGVEGSGLVNGVGASSTFIVLLYPVVLGAWVHFRNMGCNLLFVFVVFLTWFCATKLENFSVLLTMFVESTIFLFAYRRRNLYSILKLVFLLFIASYILFFLIGQQGKMHRFIESEPATPMEIISFMPSRLESDGRIDMFKSALRNIYQSPLGNGYGKHIMKEAGEKPFSSDGHWHAHNTVINYGLQMGIIGILLIGFLFFYFIVHFLSVLVSGTGSQRDAAAIGFVIVIGFAVRNLVDDFFYGTELILFMLLLAVFLVLSEEQSHKDVRV